MSEEQIVRHCAPTLAGLKTGNLFSCAFGDKAHLYREIKALNQKLTPKGLRVLPLRLRKGRALIYVYRPGALERDLSAAAAREILTDRGYAGDSSHRCLLRLMERLRTEPEFPHEIGLFLSYPPEDVRGFLENSCHKCTGCWKVYGDEAAARCQFDRFEKCARIYLAQWRQGKPVERLAVAG